MVKASPALSVTIPSTGPLRVIPVEAIVNWIGLGSRVNPVGALVSTSQ